MATSRAQPYTYDLGHMLINDPNPLPTISNSDPEKETILSTIAQDCAQHLINQLLTTCPITRSPDDAALQIDLPGPVLQLPREKPIPKEKEKTKWDKFAAKKGILPKKREGKMVYDEEKKDWVPKYGYKGSADKGDWLVEVEDEKPEKEDSKKGYGNPKEERGGPARREKKMKARKGK